MNIDDLENSLGSFDITVQKLLPEILKLNIRNNALLRVILSNQADIYNRLDETIDRDILEESWIKDSVILAEEEVTKVLLRLTS